MLTVNLSKTSYTIFKTQNKIIPEILNSVSFKHGIIHRVKSTKYLGVILDEKLNWEEHINSVITSLRKISSSFKIIKHQVHKSNKLLLYNAYIFCIHAPAYDMSLLEEFFFIEDI